MARYPSLNIVERVTSNHGRRVVYEIRLNPPLHEIRRDNRGRFVAAYEDDVTAFQNRVIELALLAHTEYRRLTSNARTRNYDWFMTVVLIAPDGQQILRPWTVLRRRDVEQEPRRRARQGNRFRNSNDILERFPASFVDSYENLTISDNEVDWQDLVVMIQFDSVGRVARGRLNRLAPAIRNSITLANTPGLYSYPAVDGDLCGYQAIVYALAVRAYMRDNWLGGVEWITSEAGTSERPLAKKLHDNPRLFKTLCTKLRALMGVEGPWIVSQVESASFAAKFVEMQPRFQVLVFNESTRMIHEQRIGSEFDVESASDCTLVLSYTLGHVHLVKSMATYLGHRKQGTHAYCYVCLKYCRRNHRCKAYVYCEVCELKFRTKTALKKHGTGHHECERCGVVCVSMNCLAAHDCRPRDQEQRTVSTTFRCRLCTNVFPKDVPHRCYMEPLEPDEVMDVRSHCEHTYAFDFESQLIIVDEDVTAHHVNLVVVKRCFTPDGCHHIFRSLAEFVEWIEQLEYPSVLYAHNMMGYDGRLLFDYLFEHRTPPAEMMWRGAKIMSMQYGKASIRDTLLHWPTSLEKLPAMFGLDEQRYKKGFFPYVFNTPQNASYVGPIPGREYFKPEQMNSKKREQFQRWYDEQVAQNVQYDFDKEMIEYCISDVEILCHSISTYVESMLQVRPLNPLSCVTIASYAMKMYRQFFMPDSVLIPRLQRKEHDNIKRAMFGGRTDTRCLLKEYSEEELSNGIAGAYQDVQSLYPTVQFYDPMPVGNPRYKSFAAEDQPQPSVEQLRSVFGFVCCDIKCTRYLHHPVIVHVDPETHRLVATLEPKKNQVICTPELRLALDNGYVVEKVHWWYDFDQSTDLFKDYIRTFLKRKVEATGLKPEHADPEVWAEFVNYHREELGVDIDRAAMESNPAQRSGMKLLLNSLWGKFGQRARNANWKMFMQGKDDDAIFALENQWMDGKINIQFRKYADTSKAVAMIYTYEEDSPFVNNADHCNIAIAAMVTSHARCRLWQQLNRLGNRVLYHDTDSIIYSTAGRGKEHEDIPCGKYLGEWESELAGDDRIIKFVSTGPKCYAYITEKGKVCCKVKGITLNHSNSEKIHYESMKRLVLEDNDEIMADALAFKHNRDVGLMITQSVKKAFKVTYGKGVIGSNYFTYPFGWQSFLGSI